jgi:hypothetical protein
MNTDLDTGNYWYLITADIKALDEFHQKKLRNYPLFPCKIEIKKG